MQLDKTDSEMDKDRSCPLKRQRPNYDSEDDEAENVASKKFK